MDRLPFTFNHNIILLNIKVNVSFNNILCGLFVIDSMKEIHRYRLNKTYDFRKSKIIISKKWPISVSSKNTFCRTFLHSSSLSTVAW